MPIAAARTSPGTLAVDPTPVFDLSPYLYMQFMEPLGSTDGSVDASWNYREDRWRRDLVEVTRELAPTLVRWGGCFASYYRWKEGVGPRDKRVPMHNLLWGGMETNQVGTREFVDFCRMVGADPLFVVNFESDGRKRWARPGRGMNRLGTAKEAAEWVDYCNNPSNRHRRRNGPKAPLRVPIWQIGNETSYDKNGFDCETAARKTVLFAKAMRKADPDIKLIGWGDVAWAPRVLEVAGEHLDYIAFHGGYHSTLPNSPLNEDDYGKDPDRTWRHLMTGADWAARKLKEMRQQTAGYDVPLALTESHYGMPGRNRCDLRGLCQDIQPVPAARRRPQDRHAGRLLRHPVDVQRRHPAHPRREKRLHDAGGPRPVAVRRAHGKEGGEGDEVPIGPRRDRQPDGKARVAARGEHAPRQVRPGGHPRRRHEDTLGQGLPDRRGPGAGGLGAERGSLRPRPEEAAGRREVDLPAGLGDGNRADRRRRRAPVTLGASRG